MVGCVRGPDTVASEELHAVPAPILIQSPQGPDVPLPALWPVDITSGLEMRCPRAHRLPKVGTPGCAKFLNSAGDWQPLLNHSGFAMLREAAYLPGGQDGMPGAQAIETG